jgi:hypothetical protein
MKIESLEVANTNLQTRLEQFANLSSAAQKSGAQAHQRLSECEEEKNELLSELQGCRVEMCRLNGLMGNPTLVKWPVDFEKWSFERLLPGVFFGASLYRRILSFIVKHYGE